MFADRVKIRVRSGDGGRGCSSFHREKYRPKMGPDGGDGGRGGDVIFEVMGNLSSLAPLVYKGHIEGERGQHGMGSDCHGHNGAHAIVPVPPGTVVRDLDADRAIVADLLEVGDRYVACRGGKGGLGNAHFVTSVNRAPRQCEDGGLGEEHYLELELKSVADVGLVGHPNAGKSTLLRAISNAEPEVASYPFTTLNPHIGLVEYDDYYRLTVADIPGLIEGAHENIGLGHHFLRHIERTKVLIFVLDLQGTDGRTPWDDLRTLIAELEAYLPGLSERPSVIAANKIDGPDAEANLKTLRTYTKLKIYPMCAELGEGIDEFLLAIRDRVRHMRV